MVSYRQCSRCHLGLQVSQNISWGMFRVGDPLPSSLTWLLAEFGPSQAMDQKPTLSSLPCEAPHHGSMLQQSILAQKREVTVFCDLITKVTSHHFNCSLSLRSKTPGSVHKEVGAGGLQLPSPEPS